MLRDTRSQPGFLSVVCLSGSLSMTWLRAQTRIDLLSRTGRGSITTGSGVCHWTSFTLKVTKSYKETFSWAIPFTIFWNWSRNQSPKISLLIRFSNSSSLSTTTAMKLTTWRRKSTWCRCLVTWFRETTGNKHTMTGSWLRRPLQIRHRTNRRLLLWTFVNQLPSAVYPELKEYLFKLSRTSMRFTSSAKVQHTLLINICKVPIWNMESTILSSVCGLTWDSSFLSKKSSILKRIRIITQKSCQVVTLGASPTSVSAPMICPIWFSKSLRRPTATFESRRLFVTSSTTSTRTPRRSIFGCSLDTASASLFHSSCRCTYS